MAYPTRYTFAFLLSLVLVSCGGAVDTPETPLVVVPQGFPVLPVPSDNKLTAERIALGKKLFFDKRLSRTEEVSCGSCHLQENAFAEPKTFSVGIHGRIGTRNAPSLANLAYNTSFFWDGGVPTLEQQAIAPILNPLEMDMTMSEVVDRISVDGGYRDLFQRAYGSAPTPEYITKGIASFIRTMVSGNSRFDKHERGDKSAMNESEVRGMTMFFDETADCFHCHVGFNLTNNSFLNNGLYLDYADSGRMLVTENPRDLAKFKVPTLRNIALTAPYMHDGSRATLEEVIEHYNSGGKEHPNLDPTLRPLELTPQQKADLLAFLKALTDEEFIRDPRFKE